MKIRIVLLLSSLLAATAGARPDTSGTPAPVDLVQPLCGTDGDANLFPGAVAPFGMLQWSPDTEAGRRSGGYAYWDKRISGFSLDHLSGAGCGYGENFAFMPVPDRVLVSPSSNRTAFISGFSHAAEVAAPGFYAVGLSNGVRVELTTTTRSGFGRFTYPAGTPATMTINAASSANGTLRSVIQIAPAQREVSGWATSGHFCGGPDETTVYFCAVFSQPFTNYGTWSGSRLTPGGTNDSGTASGAYLGFDSATSRTVLAKVAISYVSVANARANLEAESPLSAFRSQDFDSAVAAARATWNATLSRIQISGGSLAERQTFYSMLYHALLAPTVCSDVNGDYLGYDGHPHTALGYTHYGYFSGWDVYRSQCQLLAMLEPERASDMAQSLLVDYQQGGAFPRWGMPSADSGIMMGDPAAPMIAGFYAFGATNFDAPAALAGLVRAATDPSVKAPRTNTRQRDALADYLRLGYVPEFQHGGYGPAAMTLEYASADFALSQLAGALGDEPNRAASLRRAQNWQHLFNPQTGYLQMRRANGSWAPNFTNNAEVYDRQIAYVEGSAAQYVWMVPFNVKGLAQVMGGPEKATARLDEFFQELNAGPNSVHAWLGNEPCLHTPWLYCFLGQPYKTQKVVRQALAQLFSPAPKGYPGNDDLGQMSSWYVFAALGMYPALPGADILVLNSPLFPSAVVHLRQGEVTILGQGTAANAPYVQRLTLNGRPWTKPWLRFGDLARGGRLEYQLSSTPKLDWGSQPEAAPPSFDGAPKEEAQAVQRPTVSQ